MLLVRINGEQREAPDPDHNLLSVIRYDLGLTGTKHGCREGRCGTRTVLVDSQPLRACLTTVRAIVGGSIPAHEPAQYEAGTLPGG